MNQKKGIGRFMVIVLSVILVLSTSLAVNASAEAEEDTGETRTFATEAEAKAWKADVENAYAEKNANDNGYTYELNWSDILTETGTEKEPVGEAEITSFGPYETKDAAQAALEEADAADPSTPLRVVTFSDITSATTPIGEAGTGTETSESIYNSEAECQTAMEAKKAELKEAGYTIGETAVNSEGGTVSSVTVDSFAKNDYSATEYTITASGNTYIAIKQATWYAIWTPTDMEAYANTFKSYVNEKDPSTNGKTFFSMWSGFDQEFQGGKSTGTYRVINNGDGTYTLHVNDASKISHMDYGDYTAVTTGQTYSYTITYTIPAETKTEYFFSKTVQAYQYKTVYTLSYTVSKTPVTTEAETTSISVTKVWNDGNNQDKLRPESVTVTLYANGTAVAQTLTLNADNGWKGTFTDLAKNDSDNKAISYTVEENSVAGYTASITGDAANGFVITNSHTPTDGGGGGSTTTYTSLTVKKVWITDDGGTAADSVSVNLLKNGVVDQTVVLSKSNNWTYTWAWLNSAYTWTVEEANVPAGFTSSISSSVGGTVWTITNNDVAKGSIPSDTPDGTDNPNGTDQPNGTDNPGETDQPNGSDEPNELTPPADSNTHDGPVTDGKSAASGGSRSDIPETGDGTPVSSYVLLLLTSLAAMGTVIFAHSRQRYADGYEGEGGQSHKNS